MVLYLNHWFFSHLAILMSIYSITKFSTLCSYVHNWPLLRFSQGYGRASHTINVVRVTFICEWRHLHLTSIPKGDFLRNFFVANYLLSESLPDIF